MNITIPADNVLASAYRYLALLQEHCIKNGIDCTCAILTDGCCATFISNTTGIYIPSDLRVCYLFNATEEHVRMWYEHLYDTLDSAIEAYKNRRIVELEKELNRLVNRK